jgi:integrase
MEMKGRPLTRAEYQAMLLTATDRPQGGSYVHLMTGLWLSGLRRGEAMKLSWGRDAPFAVDMTGEYPRLRIRNRAQKSKRAQLAPITPDFSKFLLSQKDRSGFVFHPLGEEGQRVSADCAGRIVISIGDEAGIITDTETGRHATCHDFRRSFGDRWARKVMPPDLKELMRHRSIETTMKYYVGRDVDSIAARLHGMDDVPE